MEVTHTFSEFQISPEIIKAIEDMGFEEPTPIQLSAIPAILAGSDVTGQAQTGTGKTAAFAIPAIEIIDQKNRETQVIVLSPTRELTIQTAEEFARLTHYQKKITILPIYGGQHIERQLKGLQRGVQIVVGTPGRVLDHLRRGTLKLQGVKMVILDEGDQMLDMGFREDIETILDHTPKDRQTTLFSATMPRPILAISKKYQNNPIMVEVPHKTLTVPQIEQQYLELRNRDKMEILSRLLDIHDPNLTLIFCNTKKAVDLLTTQLQNRGYITEGLHGDMKQQQRDRVMAQFRNGNIDVLIATDVAARGIDVDDVELVINYDVPQDVEYYVHRIGRTARAGREGRAITFVGPKEIYKLRSIQKYANIQITRIPMPTVEDVKQIRLQNLTESIKETLETGKLEKYTTIIEQMMMEDYTSLEIAGALLKREMESKPEPEEISKYSSDDSRGRFDRSDRSDRGSSRPPRQFDRDTEQGMKRLHIGLGRDRGIRPKDIVGAIANETRIDGNSIGAISIFGSYSYVEVDESVADQVIDRMKGKSIGGVNLSDGVSIGYATPGNSDGPKKFKKEFKRESSKGNFQRKKSYRH